MRLRYFIFAALILFSVEGLLFGDTAAMRGKVLTVHDGDTFKVRLKNGTCETIRLLGVDTPEASKRRYNYVEYLGKEVTILLKRAILNKNIKIIVNKRKGKIVRDRYKRILGYVYSEGVDICAILLKKGLAKVYRKSRSSRSSEFIRHEETAKEKNRGVWNRSREKQYYRDLFLKTENKSLLPWFWDNDKVFLRSLLCGKK